MKIRQFLLGGTAICACLTAPARAEQGEQSHPNVLLLIADDLNDCLLSLGGKYQALTPNLDSLASQGVLFTDAHCNAPICAPSRASFLYGLLPSATGYFGYKQNKRAPERDYPVFKKSLNIMQWFRQNGYLVAGTGKIDHHFFPEDWTDRDGVHFGEQLDYGPWPGDGHSSAPKPSPNLPKPLNQNQWYGFGPLDQLPMFPDGKGEWRNYRGPSRPESHTPFRYVSDANRDKMSDEKSAEWAARFLEKSQPQPFFLAVGFGKPHAPIYLPRKYFELYPEKLFQNEDFSANGVDGLPGIARKALNPDDWGPDAYKALIDAGGNTMLARWQQAYLGAISFLDDQVGTVLDALKRGPNAKNTIVVFLSDNGYHMGEKERVFKSSLWRQSTHVPLIIKAPEAKAVGIRCSVPVSLVDIFPTLNDLCGIPVEPNKAESGRALDGVSLAALLNGRTETVQNQKVITFADRDEELGPSEPGDPRRQHATLLTAQWRFIRYSDGSEELYDRLVDSQERHNLAGNPEYADILKKLKAELDKVVQGTGENIR